MTASPCIGVLPFYVVETSKLAEAGPSGGYVIETKAKSGGPSGQGTSGLFGFVMSFLLLIIASDAWRT